MAMSSICSCISAKPGFVLTTTKSGILSWLFPTAVVIEWEYAEDGLPDQEALEQIHAFEQQITGLNNPTGNSIKVHIIRGSGLSELCYYVRDYDTFMRELNGALASSPKLPIQIEFFQDPEWQYRSSIISNFAS